MKCVFNGRENCSLAPCNEEGECLWAGPGEVVSQISRERQVVVDGIVVKDNANPKDALGAAKPSMGLIPVAAMESVARVMELGARKYGPYNWRSRAVKKMVYAHACLRHVFAWIGGQSIDKESGESHLAHAAACLFIVLDAEATGNAIEDREWLPKEAQK